MMERVVEPEERCPVCNKITKASVVTLTCDCCGKAIRSDQLALTSTELHQDDRAERRYFCCWACALTHLSRMKGDYFLELPYLQYDDVPRGCHARDFWKAVRAFGRKKARK